MYFPKTKRNNPQPTVSDFPGWGLLLFTFEIKFHLRPSLSVDFFDTLSFWTEAERNLHFFHLCKLPYSEKHFLFLALFFSEKYLFGSDFIFLSLYYLYIGITSLCLYNSIGYSLFQDGNLYKFTYLFLFITEILYTLPQKNIDNSIYCMLL